MRDRSNFGTVQCLALPPPHEVGFADGPRVADDTGSALALSVPGRMPLLLQEVRFHQSFTRIMFARVRHSAGWLLEEC